MGPEATLGSSGSDWGPHGTHAPMMRCAHLEPRQWGRRAPYHVIRYGDR
jgi:hypothetical protein